MLFSSPVFFLFFAVYFALHVALPKRYRLPLVIAGSTVFYGWWKPSYVWLPYLLMGIAFIGTAGLARGEGSPMGRLRLVLTIVALFLPLAFFKYTNFFVVDVLGPFIGAHRPVLDLSLPLGVSFVTFTLTAYVVDVYRGRFPPVRSPTTLLAYVLFFPHLIAGPILRPVELIPQLERPRPWLRAHFTAGVAIFTVGLVKKLVFADQIAGLVDATYGSSRLPHGLAALLALHGFSAQIYCDFSGYTDMAIGLAMLLGIKLPNNFLRPYGASSIVDFWRRWHITLSFWLRDYLYIPFGGNRGGGFARERNILITMVLGGLWHGANWTFVVWGALHGLGVGAVHLFRGLSRRVGLPPLPEWLGVAVTFYFVTAAWAFFRAPNLASAARILAAPVLGDWTDPAAVLGANLFPAALIAIFFLLHRFDDHRRIKLATRKLRPELLWSAIVLCWILAITVSQGSSAKFIYFDF